jgi:hypothetical protein
MVKKSLNYNYSNNKISKTTKGGRPPMANAAEEPEKRRLKQLELKMLEQQAQIAATKPLPDNLECVVCRSNIDHLNSPVYIEDEIDWKTQAIIHKKGEPKKPTFLMRCPLGEHFYCNNCFNDNVNSQISDGTEDTFNFSGLEPLYIRCSDCTGGYSNEQVQRLVGRETYENLLILINKCNSILKGDDFLCNLSQEDGGYTLVCPRCFLGPIAKKACPNMFTHHGEWNSVTRIRTNNACMRCSYLSKEMDDFILFTPGDKNCNMCNIIDGEQIGFIENQVYPVSQAIREFDTYFDWPAYFPAKADSWWSGDEGRRSFVQSIFDNRDNTFREQSENSRKESEEIEKSTIPDKFKYLKLLKIALRCGRARNSLIIFLINRLGTGSEIFTAEKTMNYLLNKEPMSSYLGPSSIAISAAEFQISSGHGRHPFYELLPEQRADKLIFPSVNAGIFALAHYIADPKHAVENYKRSASHESASLTNPLVEYDNVEKQEFIKNLTLECQISDETKTDDEILALETLANKSAEENEDIVIQCQKNIEAANSKYPNERKKALMKVLEAINASTAQLKVSLGREAFNHALESYKTYQKIIYNELYIQAHEVFKRMTE